MHSMLKHKIGETVCFYRFNRFFELLSVFIKKINNLSLNALYYSFLSFKVKVFKNLYCYMAVKILCHNIKRYFHVIATRHLSAL